MKVFIDSAYQPSVLSLKAALTVMVRVIEFTDDPNEADLVIFPGECRKYQVVNHLQAGKKVAQLLWGSNAPIVGSVHTHFRAFDGLRLGDLVEYINEVSSS